MRFFRVFASNETPTGGQASSTNVSAVLDVLKKARELIGDPSRWTQGLSARNANGGFVGVRSPDAICWCVGGAIEYVGGTCPAAFTLLDQAAVEMTNDKGIYPYLFVNDKMGHADVMRMLDRAIELAQEPLDASATVPSSSTTELATTSEDRCIDCGALEVNCDCPLFVASTSGSAEEQSETTKPSSGAVRERGE